MVRKCSEPKSTIISGFQNDVLEVLDPNDIIRIYSASQKVFVITKKGEYTTTLRLYEFEELLDNRAFIRISHSEILNLKLIKHFDLSFVGTIRVSLLDGTASFVSRRYVAKIKQTLGI